MKEKIIEWCISKQGIITIASTVIIGISLLILTLTGVTTWLQIGEFMIMAVIIVASIFLWIFHLLLFIFLLLTPFAFLYAIIKNIKEKRKNQTGEETETTLT